MTSSSPEEIMTGRKAKILEKLELELEKLQGNRSALARQIGMNVTTLGLFMKKDKFGSMVTFAQLYAAFGWPEADPRTFPEWMTQTTTGGLYPRFEPWTKERYEQWLHQDDSRREDHAEVEKSTLKEATPQEMPVHEPRHIAAASGVVNVTDALDVLLAALVEQFVVPRVKASMDNLAKSTHLTAPQQSLVQTGDEIDALMRRLAELLDYYWNCSAAERGEFVNAHADAIMLLFPALEPFVQSPDDRELMIERNRR